MAIAGSGKEAYVVLHRPIHPGTVLPAIHHLNQITESGVTRLVLVIQTPGGGIDAGLFLYEKLRALAQRCHLVTHALWLSRSPWKFAAAVRV